MFWIFIRRTDAEDEDPILWSSDAKSWLIRKDADAGKDWRQEEKGTTDRGWNGWMASLIQRTWVWASFRRWWRTAKPGVLLSTGWQRVRHNWATDNNNKAIMVKNLPAGAGNIRDMGSIPGSGRSPGEGHGQRKLENPMDRGAWRAIVHRVAQNQTWLKQLSTKLLWKT